MFYLGFYCGMLGYNKPNIFTVAGGVYVAGLAGELAQKDVNDISMIAQDTINHIPMAINQIRKS